MSEVREIEVKQAKELIEEGDVTIVDIRDGVSYQEDHIENAILIDNENVERFLKETDKQRGLLCYCYHGLNSQSAAYFFRDNGFKTVFSLQGGFEAWRHTFPIKADG